MTACQIERGISLRLAAKRVPRRIADRIGFDFHDAAARSLPTKIVHQYLADQETCERDGVDGQITSAKPSVHQPRIARPAPLPVTRQSSMIILLLRPAEGLTAIGDTDGRSTSRAAELSDATGGGVYGRALSHRGRPQAIRRILQNGLRWRNCEHGRRKRTSVHQNRQYMAHSQRWRRSHPG